MRKHRCPICGKTADSQQSPAMPFCSERCRLIDAGRWADEAYGLPHQPSDEMPDEDILPEESPGA